MIVKIVRFKRTRESIHYEKGISFECDGDMDSRIIDSEGYILEKDSNGCSVYDAKDLTEDLCINISPLLDIRV